MPLSRRHRWASFIGCILVMLVLFILIIQRNNKPFGSRNTGFAVDSDRDITRIEMSDKSGELILQSRNATWYVNHETEARKSAIAFILRSVRELSVKSPVSAEMFDSEVTQKDIEPVRIRIYSGKKLLKSYLVYKTNTEAAPNIMKLKPGSLPYIMELEGSSYNPGNHFVCDIRFWGPYTLFSADPSEISSVSVQYSNVPDSSFSILREGEDLKLSTMVPYHGDPELTAMSRYLAYYSFIPFESYAFDISEEEASAITERSPDILFSMETTDGITSELLVWTRFIAEGDSSLADTDRAWGALGHGADLLIVRYYDIDPLIKTPYYFYSE